LFPQEHHRETGTIAEGAESDLLLRVWTATAPGAAYFGVLSSPHGSRCEVDGCGDSGAGGTESDADVEEDQEMKYQANPVRVQAFKILSVELMENGAQEKTYRLTIGDGPDTLTENQQVIATGEMCSRMEPKLGDYWVIQADGYIYLNPKDVFERKYHPVQAKSQ
jgi:hypothetical protein